MIRPVQTILRLAKGLARRGSKTLKDSPVMSVAEPIATGRKISRRDFMRRVGLSADELRLQNIMASAAQEMKHTQIAAQAWLKRPDIIARIKKLRNSKDIDPRKTNKKLLRELTQDFEELKYTTEWGDEVSMYEVVSGPLKGRVIDTAGSLPGQPQFAELLGFDQLASQDLVKKVGSRAFGKRFFNLDPSKMSPFKRKLLRKLKEAERGFHQDAGYNSIKRMAKIDAGTVKPKNAIEKWYAARQRLHDVYGHKYGTGTYLNELIPLPKAASSGRKYIFGKFSSDGKKEVLSYIKDLAKNSQRPDIDFKKQNPIVEAFLEGLKK